MGKTKKNKWTMHTPADSEYNDKADGFAINEDLYAIDPETLDPGAFDSERPKKLVIRISPGHPPDQRAGQDTLYHIDTNNFYIDPNPKWGVDELAIDGVEPKQLVVVIGLLLENAAGLTSRYEGEPGPMIYPETFVSRNGVDKYKLLDQEYKPVAVLVRKMCDRTTKLYALRNKRHGLYHLMLLPGQRDVQTTNRIFYYSEWSQGPSFHEKAKRRRGWRKVADDFCAQWLEEHHPHYQPSRAPSCALSRQPTVSPDETMLPLTPRSPESDITMAPKNDRARGNGHLDAAAAVLERILHHKNPDRHHAIIKELMTGSEPWNLDRAIQAVEAYEALWTQEHHNLPSPVTPENILRLARGLRALSLGRDLALKECQYRSFIFHFCMALRRFGSGTQSTIQYAFECATDYHMRRLEGDDLAEIPGSATHRIMQKLAETFNDHIEFIEAVTESDLAALGGSTLSQPLDTFEALTDELLRTDDIGRLRDVFSQLSQYIIFQSYTSLTKVKAGLVGTRDILSSAVSSLERELNGGSGSADGSGDTPEVEETEDDAFDREALWQADDERDELESEDRSMEWF